MSVRRGSIFLLLLMLTGCKPPAEPIVAVPPVQTIRLGGVSDVPFRRFPGEVAALSSSQMSFDVAGRIVELPAAQGLVVAKGALLAQLDMTNFTARRDSARAQFNNAQTELTRRQQLRTRGVISQSELDGFQQTFEVTEAALREAQRALDDTRMVAPMDGRVAQRIANNFQNVTAKEPVLVFQDISQLEVDIQVPENDMSATERGMTSETARDLIEAFVEFAVIPNTQFPLTLESFSTQATQTARTFRVTFRLDPPDGQNILPGMTCTVLMRSKNQLAAQSYGDGTFVVPLQAISTSDGKTWIWKLDPTTMKVTRVPVEALNLETSAMHIRGAGLGEGDELVSSGVRFLSEGMVVRRLPTPTQ